MWARGLAGSHKHSLRCTPRGACYDLYGLYDLLPVHYLTPGQGNLHTVRSRTAQVKALGEECCGLQTDRFWCQIALDSIWSTPTLRCWPHVRLRTFFTARDCSPRYVNHVLAPTLCTPRASPHDVHPTCLLLTLFTARVAPYGSLRTCRATRCFRCAQRLGHVDHSGSGRPRTADLAG